MELISGDKETASPGVKEKAGTKTDSEGDRVQNKQKVKREIGDTGQEKRELGMGLGRGGLPCLIKATNLQPMSGRDPAGEEREETETDQQETREKQEETVRTVPEVRGKTNLKSDLRIKREE